MAGAHTRVRPALRVFRSTSGNRSGHDALRITVVRRTTLVRALSSFAQRRIDRQVCASPARCPHVSRRVGAPGLGVVLVVPSGVWRMR
nr:hypothetical protein JVH1_0482 [Rhodococcus sp. JVH1]